MPRTNRIGANNLDADLGEEEADEVRAAIVGSREHLTNALDVLRLIWDERDTDLLRLALMAEDLHEIARRIGA